MNRIYKLIWNPQLRAMVVASELATGHAAGSRSARLLAPRLAVLSMACALGCWGYVAPAMAQSAELADIAQLVERYSQPVEDLNALVARAAGQPLPQSPAALQPVAATAAVSVSPQAQLQIAPVRQIQVRQVRHAGLSVTPAAQIQTVTSALSSAAVSNVHSGADVTLAAVSESLAGSGSGQAGAPAGRILPMLRPRDPALGNRTNVVREGITGTVGLVESGVGKLLDKTHLGKVADGLLTGVGDVVGGVGNVLGTVVGGVTGSQALAGAVTGLTGALDDGLDNVGDNLEDTNLAGAVGAVGGAVNDAGNAVVGGALGAVGGVSGSTALGGQLGGTVDGLTGGVANGLTSLVGQVTGNPAPAPVPSASTLPLSGVGLGGLTGSSTNVSPMALPPGDPRLVSGTSRTSGLVVGTGGLVGTVGTLLGPTLQDLLGGDGYVRNGDTTISSANIVQAYSVTNVLGIPVVNLSPVGTLLDGLGGVTTGSNSHLTILGGATSDSYIYNINNGDPNGLLGLVLPDTAPAWAQSCLDVLGLAGIDCWAVNAAQDYQVIIGDGAFANGSKEVVIGTNASHRLPLVDANDVFLGDGTNDPTNPTGVPTGDYDARMGHSVVIGDNATGTANAQTLLGAGATSDKANSVALGFRSNASRGGLDNYVAFGMTAPQTSIGEVAVGSAGRERQITHVAAGSEATDAVNVAQLQAALDGVSSGVNPFAVLYADDGAGAPDYTRVALGDGAAPTTVSNLADGEVSASSDEAINGAQLYGTADSLATALGGNAVVGADGTVAAPTYTLTSIDADGTAVAADYNDVGSAFDAVDQSINNVNTRITEGLAGAVMYDTDSNGDINLGQVTFGDAGTPTLLTNVADGAVTATSSDAITGAQLFGSASSVATVIGAGAGVDADGNLTAPSFAITNIDANLGTSTGTYSDVGTAFSAMDASINNVANNLTVAIGGAVMYDRDANGDVDLTQVTFGDGTTPTLLTNVADGSVAAGSSDALTGSQLYAASASTAAALGGGAGVDGNGAVTAPAYTLTTVAADGSTSSADYDNVGSAFEAVDQSINNINTTVNNGLAGAVRYDVDAAGNVDLGQVTFGDATTQTRLTNVAAGSVDAGSTDAITGAQLFGNASSVAAVIGAGASVDANGNLLAPDFAITDIDGSLGRSTGSYDSVGAAFSAMDASINNVANNVAVAIGGAVRYDLDANGAVDFTRVTFGDGSAPTLLTNVAVGNVAAGSSDATTGAQLFGTADSLATHLGGGATVAADGTVTAPTYVVDGIDANGNLVTGTHTDVGSAFDAVGQSIRNIFNVGIPSTDPLAVHYDVDTTTGARLDSVTLVGGSAGAAVQINNVADGAVVQGSAQAVTGNQLASTNAAVSTYIGGTTSFDPTTGVWIGPNFSLTTIAADGSLSTVSYSDVTSAFDSVSQSLRNVSIQPATPVTGNIAYFDVDSTKAPAQASGGDSVAIGPNAQATGSAAVALGNDATASAAGSVAIGSGAVANRANTVSVGAAGSERQVVNVADGTQDTDAVNVRQLQAVSQSTIRYDQTSSGDIDYTSVTLGSTSSGPTRVRNVATGTAPTDAVNVGQLQAGLTQVQDWSRSYTDQRFNEIGGSIREVDNRASAGIASAMAMAGLPQPYEAGRSMASFAASSFNGEGSIAVGLSGVTEGGRWIYKISGSANTRGDGGVTVGAGIQW